MGNENDTAYISKINDNHVTVTLVIKIIIITKIIQIVILY